MCRRMSRVIFCGNLPVDVRTREIEDLFYKYGKIVEVSASSQAEHPLPVSFMVYF